MNLETNPFGVYTPTKAKFLILGSFPSKAHKTNPDYNWFYSNKTNQFWKILERIYKKNLKTKNEKKGLLKKLRIAITDIIYKCQREDGSSLDVNLKNIIYNKAGIEKILKNNTIKKIYFTSRYVEKNFKRHFKELIDKYPDIKLITLPSPSTRYASVRFEEKLKIYKKLLPTANANLS